MLGRSGFLENTRTGWGSAEFMNTFATIQSPDGRYSVEQQDDYGEIGMGSPAFGHIIFGGADVQFPDELFGEAVLFSPNSRFVALEQLVETRPFRTKLIAVELPRGTVHVIRLQPHGRRFQSVHGPAWASACTSAGIRKRRK
jgi:hypothetical protein